MLTSKHRFRPSLWPSLAFMALLGPLLALGHWQLGRAEEKRALSAALSAGAAADPVALGAGAAALHARVRLAGHWDPARQVLMDAMPQGGRAGYRVLTPLVRATDVVLVDRGWVPADPDRRLLPEIALEPAPVEVTGLAAGWPEPGLRAGPADDAGRWPRVLYFPTHAELAALYDRPLHAQRVLLDPHLPDGFDRTRITDGFGPERHLGYALTWFALALTLTILYIASQTHRIDAA